tara:strand:+ start:1085 stop:1834 length:750 start_codon:yes stop_codon:yes gene_type:complete
MTVLYVNGCSHTAGAELVGAGQYDNSKDPRDDNRKLSWSGQLHKRYFSSWEYMNNAFSGSNNESIALHTIDDIEQLISDGEKDIRVLIGWTSTWRYHFELPEDDDLRCYKNKAKFFVGYDLSGDLQFMPFAKQLWQGLNSFHNILEDEKTFIRDYTLLANYLKSQNLKYCMIHFLCHPPALTNRYRHIYNLYYQDQSVIGHNKNKSTAHEFMRQNNHLDNIDGRTGHYTVDAHIDFASYIGEEVKICLG